MVRTRDLSRGSCVLVFLRSFFLSFFLSYVLYFFLSSVLKSGTHQRRERSESIVSRAPFMQCGVVRGGGLGSSTIFKKFNEPYAPS